MSDFPMQEITIFHKNEYKEYERFVKLASIRNTSLLNRNKTGISTNDNAIVRIFDTEYYNTSLVDDNFPTLNMPLDCFLGVNWKVQKDDIIVNGEVFDTIETTASATELSKKYGKENVFKVNSVQIFIYDDVDLKELNHVKLGLV